MTKSIAILNGESRVGLAIARSFGKRKIPVFVGGTSKFSRAFYSKHCIKSFRYSPSVFGIERMHEDILRGIIKLEPDVLMPCGHETTYVVLKYLKEYKKYCTVVPLADFNKFNLANDKEMMTKTVAKLGFQVPKTYFPRDLDHVKELSSSIKYPVLIKPRISSFARGIVKVDSSFELIKQYSLVSSHEKDEASYDASRPIVQEYIPVTDTHAVDVLFDHGKHIASIAKIAYRSYPLPFGAPIAHIMIADDNLRLMIVRLFEKLKWNGPGSVQMMVDPRDGIAKIIEINPRMWATVESSIKVGQDIPYLMYKMAIGDKIDYKNKYKANQKFRWILYGELLYLLKTKNKFKTILDCLDFKNTKTEIDFSDFVPHMAHFVDFIVNNQIL